MKHVCVFIFFLLFGNGAFADMESIDKYMSSADAKLLREAKWQPEWQFNGKIVWWKSIHEETEREVRASAEIMTIFYDFEGLEIYSQFVLLTIGSRCKGQEYFHGLMWSKDQDSGYQWYCSGMPEKREIPAELQNIFIPFPKEIATFGN